VILVGAGVSAATVASNAMIALGVAHEYLGVGIGLATTARAVGGSIATTVYSVMLQDNVAKNLPLNLGTALIKAGLLIADIAAVATALVTGNTTSPALELASPAELGAGIAAI
jgi:formate hydrogenlyase subunit 4